VSSSLNGTTIATGVVIVGGLLILSVLLYMFDTWATSRIDTMLMDYYGPELYSKMTAEFDPDGVAALSKSLLLEKSKQISDISDRFGGHFDGWSDEDVIRAYLLQQLRSEDPAASRYMQPMQPVFTSSSQLAGY